MGLHEGENKKYLNISLGKIRQKSNKDDEKAVVRENAQGNEVWERVYYSVTGILKNLTFYEHDEFGKSWTIHLEDGDDNFAIQVKEDSKYCIDLLKKIPNMNLGEMYRFTPYDFEKLGKRKAGMSINKFSGDGKEEKISSYYQEFTKKQNGAWDVKNIHQFPNFEGDSKDKDEIKVYYIKVAKFLRNQTKLWLENKTETHNDNDDDLPF